jgi:hypothetical protein
VGEGGVPAEASWRGLSGSAAVGHDGDRAHTKQGAAMSLLNSAKNFALKNKDKVAAGVVKATTVIYKKTGGKHTRRGGRQVRRQAGAEDHGGRCSCDPGDRRTADAQARLISVRRV